MLSTATLPAAHQFHAWDMVPTPRRTRRVANVLGVLLLLSVVGMVFLPWQQTARGSGRVVAYSPTDRPQIVESPIYGRVVRWGDGILEGAVVKKGQLMLEIADNDPERAGRLQSQVEATRAKLETATDKTDTYRQQIEELKAAREMVIESGEQLVEMARAKVAAEKQGLQAAVAAELQLKLDRARQEQLAKEGFAPVLKAQEAVSKHDQAVAKVEAARQYIEAADKELNSKIADLGTKRREAQVKIQYAEASRQEALGEAALARKELLEIEGKASQFSRRRVEAPKDGIIFRLHASENAEMLKEGDPLFTIVPATTTPAVELWVNGNDMPLVNVGREVRLQFEGWPAIQFAGWPSVAVGTFAGEVVALDSTDDGKGKFRVLVRPRKLEDWPSENYLRQGTRANGWVLLNEVALGYEIWRNMNGFPPVVSPDEPKDSKDSKKVKLPK